jgi:hypothetical protein
MINVVRSKSNPTQILVDLEVSVSGMRVSVGAGTIKFGGVSFSFAEDQFTFPVKTEARVAQGFIVIEDGTAKLFIDDGEGYTFSRTGPYTPVAGIFDVAIPANASSLVDLTMNRYVVGA